MNTLVFDIETIPDLEGGRRLYALDGLPDKEVGTILFHKRRQETGNSEILRHHLYRICAISVVVHTSREFKVFSLGDATSSEQDLIKEFFALIERYVPTLVSWNGSGFDLPVLHYRSLMHTIAAPKYWGMGEEDKEFRSNNYISRYHWRHTDLMDVLAAYQTQASVSLDELSILCGLPGKMGMSGQKVWDLYLEGKAASIRQFSEIDVLNTFLLFTRFEFMRGKLLPSALESRTTQVRNYLAAQSQPHFQEFLQAWKSN